MKTVLPRKTWKDFVVKVEKSYFDIVETLSMIFKIKVQPKIAYFIK